MSYDRDMLKRLTEERMVEAKTLLASGLYSGAYYLAGYAIECALKAIIAKSFRADTIPDLKRVKDIYVHNLADLARLAQLEQELEEEKKANPLLYEKWTRIKVWSEKARYQIWTEDRASAILEAIDGEEGLLQWLRNRW